jgi:hypothetical protein
MDPRHAYVLSFRRTLHHWRTANLSESDCLSLARTTAQREHPLTDEQRRDVDEFLKGETERKSVWQHTGECERWIDFED